MNSQWRTFISKTTRRTKLRLRLCWDCDAFTCSRICCSFLYHMFKALFFKLFLKLKFIDDAQGDVGHVKAGETPQCCCSSSVWTSGSAVRRGFMADNHVAAPTLQQTITPLGCFCQRPPRSSREMSVMSLKWSGSHQCLLWMSSARRLSLFRVS